MVEPLCLQIVCLMSNRSTCWSHATKLHEFLFVVNCVFLCICNPLDTNCTFTICYYFPLLHIVISSIAPPFYWPKQLQCNWYSVEEIEKLQWLVGPSLSYNLDIFQLGCTTIIMNGQDVLCLSAKGDGKLALICLAAIAQKGTTTQVVCPTNFLESTTAPFILCYLYYPSVELPVLRLHSKGVPAQAINADTYGSQIRWPHIWAKWKTGMYQVFLFSPEMTTTDKYNMSIHDKVGWLQIGYLVVDEIPLIYE